MNLQQTSFSIVTLILVSLVGINATVDGQIYNISWYTIDGGGGYSNGGPYDLQGTIGQPDAGPQLTGGPYEVSGGYWVGAKPVFEVAPDLFFVTRGNHVGGGIGELANSDNADVSIQRAVADILSRTEFQVKSVSPIVNPSVMELTLEGAVFARTPVSQSIALYDYANADWVVIDSRPANRIFDVTVVANASGDLSRFVEPHTRCIEARIRYQSTNPRQNFASNTDRVGWTLQ